MWKGDKGVKGDPALKKDGSVSSTFVIDALLARLLCQHCHMNKLGFSLSLVGKNQGEALLSMLLWNSVDLVRTLDIGNLFLI